MGHRELIESLRKEGEANISQLWSEVKAEAEKINAETARRIDVLREKYDEVREVEVSKHEQSILAGAKNRAHVIKLLAEKALSERFFPLAMLNLRELRDHAYKDVFAELVAGLPDMAWDNVRVNPQDLEMARGHFPDSSIIPDDNISGGLEVSREEGRVCIVDTFEKRLEKAWEDILPLLINEVYKEVSAHEPSPDS